MFKRRHPLSTTSITNDERQIVLMVVKNNVENTNECTVKRNSQNSQNSQNSRIFRPKELLLEDLVRIVFDYSFNILI